MFINPYYPIVNKIFKSEKLEISHDFFRIKYQPGKSVYHFENCHFEGLEINNYKDIYFEKITVTFSYCIIKNLVIDEIKTSNISISFHSCIIDGKISSENLNSIYFFNCITPDFRLVNLKSVHFSHNDMVYLKKWINLLKYTDIRNINEILEIPQNLSIQKLKTIRFIRQPNYPNKSGIHRLNKNSNNENETIYYLSQAQKNLLNLSISIHFSDQDDEFVHIKNFILNSLSMTGDSSGKISIENTAINNLYIRDFKTKGEMLFYNIYPYLKDSKLEIHKSIMDNVWFDNIDLNSYKILSFYRTRFAKAIFTSCNFPEDNLSFKKFQTLENIHEPDEKSQNYYKDQYEIYLQLKKSFEMTGNFYEAQKVGAISKESLRKIHNLQPLDKFILWLNSISNNHGLSIRLPFIGFICSSVLLYILYLLSIERIFNSNSIDWKLIGHYFTFIDLTHKNNFLVSGDELTFWPLFIDFFNKIIVGFFLYQFIASFRKFGKQ